MTGSNRPGEPSGESDEAAEDAHHERHAESDHLRDSFDIDESADRTPRPGPVAPATPGAPAPSPAVNSPSGTETPDPGAKSGQPIPEAGRRRRRKQRRKAPWWELPALVALAIVIAILVKTFLVQPFYIPSQSMEKTLHGCPGCSGDRILVNKIVYDFRDPHPGDIVVFNAPPGWNDEPPQQPPSNPVLRFIRGFGQLIGFVPPDGLVLVKRVIAIGGQTVKGDAAGHVYISDHGPKGPYRKLDETYVYESGVDPRAKFGPITVPKARVWVMGDHRDESADSRYHCGSGGQDSGPGRCLDPTAATVPIGDVIGKAVLIAWPPSRWTTLGTPKTFESASAGLAGTGLVPVAVVAPVFFVLRRRRRRR
jgi:signal peptidase I